MLLSGLLILCFAVGATRKWLLNILCFAVVLGLIFYTTLGLVFMDDTFHTWARCCVCECEPPRACPNPECCCDTCKCCPCICGTQPMPKEVK